MSHVLDDLELYVLGVLPPAARERTESHLAVCAECRAEAAGLDQVVSALQDALPEREPPASLRERILGAARQERVAATAPRARTAARRWLAAAALAAVAVALAAAGLGLDSRLAALREERDAALAIAERVSHGGKSWYMSGVDRWKGAGALLVVPQASPAYVVFHDLPAVSAGSSYTIWLVDAEGRWVRGSSFAPTDSRVRLVDVGVPVEGFDRCAVTLETRTQGKREGPIVMQSRMYPPQQ
jgi:hypothetical protein